MIATTMARDASGLNRPDLPRPDHPDSPSRQPDSAHIVLYDPDCGLCRWCTALLLRWDVAGRLRPLALGTRRADALLADLTPEQRTASWHLLAPGGERRSGGAALAAVLGLLPGGRLPALLLARLPGLTERGYRFVARHRGTLSRLIPARAKKRAAERIAAIERALPDDR